MKRVLLCGALLMLAVACAAPVAQDNADTLTDAARAYPNWTRLFDAPRNVSMQLMLLCRTLNDDEQAYVASEHAQYFVQVYVNPVGENAMRAEGARTFPEGTVIVKEKWMRDENTGQPTDAKQPAGFGIMRKTNGTWEYGYMDENGKLTRDPKQLEHCAACHEKNRARDAVFYPDVLSFGE